MFELPHALTGQGLLRFLSWTGSNCLTKMASHHDISDVSSPRDMKDHPSTSPSPSQAEESDINGDGTTLPALSSVDSGSDANQDYLVHAFGQLGIQKRLPMAERMFASLERIFQHTFEIHRIDLGAHDWHARLQRADENSRRGIRDIEVLKWIRTVLDQLRLLDPEDLAESANVLANGSRDGITNILRT